MLSTLKDRTSTEEKLSISQSKTTNTLSTTEHDRMKFNQTNDFFKHKCPWNGCRKTFPFYSLLQTHYRTHSKFKIYTCSYPSCNQPKFTLKGNAVYHICNYHQKSREEAMKYVKVDEKKLEQEKLELLGIVKPESQKYFGLLLPRFHTIKRDSITGKFECPFGGCEVKQRSKDNLKKHYRAHGNDNYKPYQCIFDPASCQYSCKQIGNAYKHIRAVHLTSQQISSNSNANHVKCSAFIQTSTDLLKIENALFDNAKIVQNGAQKREPPRPFACPFVHCSKRFSLSGQVFSHYLTHKKSKPYKCSYPSCNYASEFKGNILNHIYLIHFKIHWKTISDIRAEHKKAAKQYVEVLEDLLLQEKANYSSMIRDVRREKNHNNIRRQNGTSLLETSFGYETPECKFDPHKVIKIELD